MKKIKQVKNWISPTNLKDLAYLGVVKTNRVIFPKGYRPKGIQLKLFAHQLSLKDLDLVTVGLTQYYTYTYEGRIKSGELVKIILSWPKKTVFNEKTLRCFISQDRQLSVKQILKHYTRRWPFPIKGGNMLRMAGDPLKHFPWYQTKLWIGELSISHLKRN